MKKEVKRFFLIWVNFVIILILTWTLYAALWTDWIIPDSLEKQSWETLKSSDWNNVLANINVLNNKIISLEQKLDSVEWNFESQIIEAFPIWSIIMTTNWENPNSYLWYWTWEAWWNWRAPVWVNTNEVEFNSVEKIWWAKTHTLTTAQMPSHSHSISSDWNHTHTITVNTSWNPDWWGDSWRSYWNNVWWSNSPSTSAAWSHAHTIYSTWWGSAHNNLQPYITAYMWKRIN